MDLGNYSETKIVETAKYLFITFNWFNSSVDDCIEEIAKENGYKSYYKDSFDFMDGRISLINLEKHEAFHYFDVVINDDIVHAIYERVA
jgi:hypothetical protein